MAKSPGHLRALRRSRAMAAVPLTFRWTSADPRSQSCRIGGEGGLAVKKWGNHETLRKTTVFTWKIMKHWEKPRFLPWENHETLRKTTFLPWKSWNIEKNTVFTMQNHETWEKPRFLPCKFMKHWEKPRFFHGKFETWGKTMVLTMENMENAGKTHGKKGWKNWEKCRKLMKNYEKWKVRYANFHLLEQKKVE